MADTSSRAGQFFYVIEDELDILFVDDDPILREFASVHLSSEKVTVKTAGDGLMALGCLKTGHPDIILLDLEMPNMDGFQFLDELKRDHPGHDFPVIVVTGREDVVAIDRAYQAGAISFVVKPLNWRQLSYQIRYVHRSHRNEMALRQARVRAEAQLRQVASQSHEFLATALQRHPDLTLAAAGYAKELASIMGAKQK